MQLTVLPPKDFPFELLVDSYVLAGSQDDKRALQQAYKNHSLYKQHPSYLQRIKTYRDYEQPTLEGRYVTPVSLSCVKTYLSGYYLLTKDISKAYNEGYIQSLAEMYHASKCQGVELEFDSTNETEVAISNLFTELETTFDSLGYVYVEELIAKRFRATDASVNKWLFYNVTEDRDWIKQLLSLGRVKQVVVSPQWALNYYHQHSYGRNGHVSQFHDVLMASKPTQLLEQPIPLTLLPNELSHEIQLLSEIKERLLHNERLLIVVPNQDWLRKLSVLLNQYGYSHYYKALKLKDTLFKDIELIIKLLFDEFSYYDYLAYTQLRYVNYPHPELDSMTADLIFKVVFCRNGQLRINLATFKQRLSDSEIDLNGILPLLKLKTTFTTQPLLGTYKSLVEPCCIARYAEWMMNYFKLNSESYLEELQVSLTHSWKRLELYLATVELTQDPTHVKWLLNYLTKNLETILTIPAPIDILTIKELSETTVSKYDHTLVVNVHNQLWTNKPPARLLALTVIQERNQLTLPYMGLGLYLSYLTESKAVSYTLIDNSIQAFKGHKVMLGMNYMNLADYFKSFKVRVNYASFKILSQPNQPDVSFEAIQAYAANQAWKVSVTDLVSNKNYPEILISVVLLKLRANEWYKLLNINQLMGSFIHEVLNAETKEDFKQRYRLLRDGVIALNRSVLLNYELIHNEGYWLNLLDAIAKDLALYPTPKYKHKQEKPTHTTITTSTDQGTIHWHLKAKVDRWIETTHEDGTTTVIYWDYKTSPPEFTNPKEPLLFNFDQLKLYAMIGYSKNQATIKLSYINLMEKELKNANLNTKDKNKIELSGNEVSGYEAELVDFFTLLMGTDWTALKNLKIKNSKIKNSSLTFNPMSDYRTLLRATE